MKHSSRNYTKLTCAVVVGMVIGHGQLALAGWTGAMNGTGYGQASVNVRAYDTSLLKKKTVTTTNMVSPSASIAPTVGYATNAFLPADASPATVAKVIGYPGYVWQATTVGSDGDSTDNAELESRVTITASDCASLEMASLAVIAPEGNSGTITVNAKGTAGTALWLRGIEFNGDPSELPNDDPATEDVNETIEFLKTNVNSSLKWDILLVGPFDLNTANCSALTIPFTIETDTNNLYFVSDGVAKSLPLVIHCPNDVLVDCDQQQPVVYPPVQVAGCGPIEIEYDPPQGTVLPEGVTAVTVTATDKDGNTNSCTFNVTVRLLKFIGFYAPIGKDSGTCNKPALIKQLGSVIPIKFDMKCGSEYVTGGQSPVVKIRKYTGCVDGEELFSANAEYQNDWHANWDTSGWAKGLYKVVVILPNGTQQYAIVELK